MSRAHKVLDTWFKNRERQQTVQIPTPAERKAQLEKQQNKKIKVDEGDSLEALNKEEQMDLKKIREALVKVKQPKYEPKEAETIMNKEAEPGVKAAANNTIDLSGVVKKDKKVAEAAEPRKDSIALPAVKAAANNTVDPTLEPTPKRSNSGKADAIKKNPSSIAIADLMNKLGIKESKRPLPWENQDTKKEVNKLGQQAGKGIKSGENVIDKSGAIHTPMSRARHLARSAMQQMIKMNPKMAESWDNKTLAKLAALEEKAANPEPVKEELQDQQPTTFAFHVGEIVTCKQSGRDCVIQSVEGDQYTAVYADGSTSTGPADWFAKQPAAVGEARVFSGDTRTWNVKTLKPAGSGIIGKKVRSYDFPGMHDSHYMEGHVTDEDPHSYTIRTTKVVRHHKEEPIAAHHTIIKAPKGISLWSGVPGVYYAPREEAKMRTAKTVNKLRGGK